MLTYRLSSIMSHHGPDLLETMLSLYPILFTDFGGYDIYIIVLVRAAEC